MYIKSVYVVDEVSAFVQAVDSVTFPVIGKHINFMYGHYLEIVDRLAQMTGSLNIEDRQGKYPLVALFQDFPEEREPEAGIYSRVMLNMIIANITEPNYTAQQRYDNNFKLVLYPIYREFLHQMARPQFKSVMVPADERIEHTKIDRVYWGREGLYGGSANVFNDYLDGIEIKNLKLSFYNHY